MDGPWADDTVTNYCNTARMRSGLGLAQPSGAWTNGFTYDAAHRLSTVISPAGTFTYTYKGPGNLVTNLALPNTSRITNAFDSVGRVTSTRLLTSSSSLLNAHSYTYNLASQRTNQARTDASTVTYTYDNLGQLKSAIGSGGQSTENLGYLYDAAWNLNKRTNNGTPTTFAVDGKNQLTSVGGLSCSYDDNGNLTTRVPVSMCYIYYTYDDENQLTSVATDTSGTPTGSRWRSDFTYDGRGRLRRRVDYTWYTYPPGSWIPAGEVRYVYDGMRVIQERDASNVPTVAYTRGSDLSGSLEGAGGIGGLLARSAYSGGAWGSHNCYQADGNGNVTALVNSSQAVSAGYRYNPYGAVIGLSGGSMTNQNVYRFSSKEVMPKSGLSYYGYRFYDPNLQRWLNRDPLEEEGGFNLYAFVDNSPSGNIDPVGLGVELPHPDPWTPTEEAALARIVHDCCQGPGSQASTTDCAIVCNKFGQGGSVAGPAYLTCMHNCEQCGRTWLNLTFEKARRLGRIPLAKIPQKPAPPQRPTPPQKPKPKEKPPQKGPR